MGRTLTNKLDDVSPGLDAAVAERLPVGVEEVHVPHVALADAYQDQGQRHQVVGALDEQTLRRLHVCRSPLAEWDKHRERKRKRHTKT